MQLIKIAALAAATTAVSAQDMSICDKYTVALLKDNTAANQLALLTLLVNTVVIGNYTGPGTNQSSLPGSMVAVPGILAAGTYKGSKVNLAPYFTGALASTNLGNGPEAVNWLDGGGATPLLTKATSSGTTGSKQYTLLTHLYQFFGALLGCSMMGTSDFPSYAGNPSMYDVHKYMALDEAEIGYFITQVGLAATSFGASSADVATVGTALFSTFGMRCSPAANITSSTPELQAICIASDCPEATTPDCSAYPSAVAAPSPASSMSMTMASSATDMTMSMPMTMSMATSATAAASSSTGAAAATMIPGAAALGLAGLVAMAM